MALPHDGIVARSGTGLYETHALKANRPDGTLALWIRHTLLRPLHGPAVAEIWFAWFERGQPPRVTRTDIRWERLTLGDGPSIEGPDVSFSPRRARGRLAGTAWDLALSGGLPPVLHLPNRLLYESPWPRRKMCTPAPNLRFDGSISLDGRDVPVEGWIGARSHAWGAEQAATYLWGTCNTWDDGAERVLDGFTARLSLGRDLASPAVTCLVVRGPEGEYHLNQPRHWMLGARYEPTAWDVRRGDVRVTMACTAADLVGLRYTLPRRGEGYCYGTKHARVTLETPSGCATSSCGEMEVFYNRPVPGVILHPSASWTPDDGPYDSARAAP